MLIIAAIFLAQAPPAGLIESKEFSHTIQWKAIESSPRIIIPLANGGTGSSVVVGVRGDFAYALTAAHVVREDINFEADFFRRETYPVPEFSIRAVKVISRNPTADLALLQIPLQAGQHTPRLRLIPPLARAKYFPFPALTVGSDDGFSARCQEHLITGRRFIRRIEDTAAFFWESRDISKPGRSGGPLLNDKLEVIGICVANQHDRGYFSYADEIHAWLKQLGYGWLWQDE